MQFSRKAVPFLGLATLAALGLATAPAANAQGVFTVVVGSGGTDTTSHNYSVGYTFTTDAAATTLSALGYYAPSALAEGHQVGLFTADGATELAAATVPSGVVGGSDSFAYTSAITKLAGFTGTLTPNTTYTIGGYVGNNTVSDPIVGANPNGSVTASQGFVYGSPVYGGGPGNTGLVAPTTVPGGTPNAYFGPNLQVAAAPEPSQTAVLGLGLLGLAGLALKARKRCVA